MTPDELRPILQGYRKQVEQGWSKATAHEGYEGKRRDPAGQCGVTSAWLQRRLREDHGIATVFCSGSVAPKFDGDPMPDHCWLEIGHGVDRVVVDLTVDQAFQGVEFFGGHQDLVTRSRHYIARRRLSAELMLDNPVQPRLAILTEVVDATSGPYRIMRITKKDGSEHAILYDAGDAEIVEARTWFIVADGTPGLFYAASSYRRPDGQPARHRMHALLMGRSGIDHINRNGLDNRRSNLRIATKSQNAVNRPPRPGTSQYKGVHWHKNSRKWSVCIQINGVKKYLGYFHDEVKAAQVYDANARDLFGEYAYLNFPVAAKALS